MRYCTCRSNQPSCGKPACPGKPRGCTGTQDASCVYYHLDNNKPSLLRCSRIPNGYSIEKILETMDQVICSMQTDWSCVDTACLKTEYPITSLGQFAQAVSAEICRIREQIKPEPVVESCDPFINLSVTDGRIKACLNVEALVDAITANPEWKAKFCCGPDSGACAITELSVATTALADPGSLILAEDTGGFAGINSGYLFQP